MGLKPGQWPILQNIPRLAEIDLSGGTATALLNTATTSYNSRVLQTENARKLALAIWIRGVTGSANVSFNVQGASAAGGTVWYTLTAQSGTKESSFTLANVMGPKVRIFEVAWPITRVRLILSGGAGTAMKISHLRGWIQS